MSNIHPTALVDERATIHPEATIGPFCIIGPDVTIGAGTELHNHVTVQRLTTIGEDNVIYPYSVIGADPQDRKFLGEASHCTIGNGNCIREHVTIHRGTANGGGHTEIGNDNLIMVAAHIAHDCVIGDHTTIANQVMLAGHVTVHDAANIGGGAGVHHFATVGRCSFVGGLARITKDVPPYMIVEGNPAEVRAVNAIAMTRQGHDDATIDAMKTAFRRLYRENGAAMAAKLEGLREEYAAVPCVMELCEALSARGDAINGRAMERARPDDKRAVAADDA